MSAKPAAQREYKIDGREVGVGERDGTGGSAVYAMAGLLLRRTTSPQTGSVPGILVSIAPEFRRDFSQ